MRSRFTLVLTVLLSTMLLGISAPAHAAAETPVPVGNGVDFVGHGFGHGIGMSQYGAQGRASKSWHAASILRFYYPGTTFSKVSANIRVWLKGDIDTDTVVLPKSGLAITDSGRPGKVFKLPTTVGATAWRLTGSGSSSGFKLSYANNGWHTYFPGGHALVGYGEFRTASYTVTLRTPGGNKSYRGTIQRRNEHTINRTSLESYVKGVLAAEMPAYWRSEALKAQAIAARTYGAYYVGKNTGPQNTYDVNDTTGFQVYGGMAAETTRTTSIVTATAGQVVEYGGEPILAKFSSQNAGWTVAEPGVPYLIAQPDTYEKYAIDPATAWKYSPGFSTLQSKLANLANTEKYGHVHIGTLKNLQVMTRDGHGFYGGRVTSIRLDGSSADVTVDAADFRSALSLRSTWFRLS